MILASRNLHKVAEVSEILGVPIDPAPADLPDPVEDAVTFAGNALIKARQVVEATGEPALADDSGLCVEVLGGAPGIFSARWAGHHGDDAANLHLLLAQLEDVPDQHRRAHFECAAVLVMPDGREFIRVGTMPGTLLREPRGSGGFGYDPILQPDGCDVSSAELTPEQKNTISHRGKAFRALAEDLRAAGLLDA